MAQTRQFPADPPLFDFDGSANEAWGNEAVKDGAAEDARGTLLKLIQIIVRTEND